MTWFLNRQGVALGLLLASIAQAAEAGPATQPSRQQYRAYAMVHQGDAPSGKALFLEQRKTACVICHTTDGKGNKAGPDLFAIGDKYGRDDLIQQVLFPSATIAEGYAATILRLKNGDLVQGVVKESTGDEVGLMGSDGILLRVKCSEIERRTISPISLMPEGLEGTLTLQQFADLIGYLASLKAPETTAAAGHGMPAEIPALKTPVALEPINSPGNAFKHPAWLGTVPGLAGAFAVAEHETGTIWLLEKDVSAESKTLFVETGRAQTGTHGLVSMVFHPRFAQNRKYYLVRHTSGGDRFPSIVLQGIAAPDLKSDSGQPLQPIISFPGVTNGDHAGGMAFGPDGCLYLGMGDSGPMGDPQGHGQDLSTLLGKILRIDVDHPEPGKPYSIPSGNPFANTPGARPEIWACGLREPWRFSFDPTSGDLWVGDVGQDLYEEIDLLRAGENAGWNVMEGFERFSNRYRRPDQPYLPPVFAYPRKYGQTVIGGCVYRANPRSSFYGVYIFADYQKKLIFALTQKNRLLDQVRVIATCPQSITSFAQDAAGQIHCVGYEGNIYKLDLDSVRFE